MFTKREIELVIQALKSTRPNIREDEARTKWRKSVRNFAKDMTDGTDDNVNRFILSCMC